MADAWLSLHDDEHADSEDGPIPWLEEVSRNAKVSTFSVEASPSPQLLGELTCHKHSLF